MRDYWVYMVLCRDGSYYAGVTNDADRRVAEHNSGLDVHCYTFTRRPVHLVYAAHFYDVDEAIRWEKQIKGWSRRKKAALASGNWDALRDAARSAERAPRQARGPSTGSG